MSEITAIELGADRVTAVTAAETGIVRAGSEAVGDGGLRAALDRTGVDLARACLVIPRGQAVLRDLELPDGTPEEQVAMVRFQVERELPIPIDQVRYSYVETGRKDGKVRIQVAAVPREAIDPSVASLESAGVKVAGAFVSSYGLLGLAGADGTAAVVEVSGGEAEILIADGGKMASSRTAPISNGPDAGALASEIQRTIQAWTAKASGRAVGKVILAGEGAEADRLAGELRRQLSLDVEVTGPGDLETAPAAAICRAVLRGLPVPDLLHPPAPPKKRTLTPNRRIALLAGAIVGVLILWALMSVSGMESDLERKRNELKGLKPRVEALEKLERRVARANEWYGGRDVWVPAFTALCGEISTGDLWIENATFDDAGVVRLQGRAKDSKHVHALVASLTKRGLFQEVSTGEVVNSRDKGGYPKSFSVTARLKGYEQARSR